MTNTAMPTATTSGVEDLCVEVDVLSLTNTSPRSAGSPLPLSPPAPAPSSHPGDIDESVSGIVLDDMESDLGDAAKFGVTDAGKSLLERGVVRKR